MSDGNPYLPPQQNDPPQAPPPGVTPGKTSASALDAIIPTNPLAVVSCYTGLFSIFPCCVIGVLLGPIAIATGMIALKKNQSWESDYGATTSKIRMWIGIVSGVIGTIAGLIVIGVTVFNIVQSR